MSVDLKHGFIRQIATGTASEHDGHHCEEVLNEHNTGAPHKTLPAAFGASYKSMTYNTEM